jgi:hypothetical protein
MSGFTFHTDNANAEIRMVLLLKCQPSFSEAEIATDDLMKHKLIDGPIGHMLTKLIHAGGNTLHSEMHEHIHSVWKKGISHSSVMKLLYYLFIKTVIKFTILFVKEYCQLHTFYATSFTMFHK